jgi:hypothetical protein
LTIVRSGRLARMTVTSATTLRAQGLPAELGHAVHELIGRQIDLDEFTRRFLTSRVYLLCPVRPGLFVMSRPAGPAIVPVWSTVRALRHVMRGYDWASCTGEDLVGRLPDGVGVLIDDGMPCPVTLPASVLREHR